MSDEQTLENQDTVYDEPVEGISFTTTCEHEMIKADQQDTNSDLVSYQCTKCPHGENRSQ